MNPGSCLWGMWFHVLGPPFAHLVNGEVDCVDLIGFLWAVSELLFISTRDGADLSVIASCCSPLLPAGRECESEGVCSWITAQTLSF